LSVSRVLSRTIIYLGAPLLVRSSGYRTVRADHSNVRSSLQPTGFTSSACYHASLWALTSLLSPLPPGAHLRRNGSW